MTLVIDNYDSFTYNLVQLLGKFTPDIVVHRNDRISIEHIETLRPERILISPGPGRPENAGISVEVIRRLGRYVPILGVCLGHQAIGFAFGGSIVHAPRLMHGRSSLIHHRSSRLFEGVATPFIATRYHSLVVAPDALPRDLEITAEADDHSIMGLRHRQFPIEGVQFHPESILTQAGEHIIRNWLKVQ
jgi:anthranilate synthase/aminodeoxychorismate synthase-like glutamine amidotransferase